MTKQPLYRMGDVVRFISKKFWTRGDALIGTIYGLRETIFGNYKYLIYYEYKYKWDNSDIDEPVSTMRTAERVREKKVLFKM